MIYTVTLNPAIDYVVKLENLAMGMTNRTVEEKHFPGGKGINVSRILRELGYESKILGILGGFTGKAIEDSLKEKGLDTDFIYSEKGITRINIKIKASEETEINGQGTLPSIEIIEQLKEKLSDLKSGDVVVLSGSIPKSLPDDTYLRLLEHIKSISGDIITVVDTTGKRLMEALKGKPFLIKPNRDELYELLGENTSVEEGARKLQELGAGNVIISMGADGAVLLSEDGRLYREKACVGSVVNTVGSGDSMIAGFIAGYLEKHSYEYALKLGAASGGATAFSDDLATGAEIREQMERL